MRALLALAASCLLPLAAAGAEPAERERYIPPGMLADGREAEIYDGWLGDSLRAMDEPILLGRPLPGELRRRYRFVLSINHGGVTAIRVDQRRADGGARVRAVELSGGRTPRIVREQVYDIDRDAMLALQRAVDLARLRGMPALLPQIAPTSNGEDNDICYSGLQLFFELVEERDSQFVTRDGCEMNAWMYRLLETIDPLRAR